MHTRRFSVLILGVWAGISLAMFFIATQNFVAVDRILDAPAEAAGKILNHTGPEQGRALLRHQAAELNRYYFDWYGLVQILLAALLAAALLFAVQKNRLMLGIGAGLFLLVCFQKAYLTPEITALGRSFDFAAPGTVFPTRPRFRNFHMAFNVTELVKTGLMLFVGVKLLLRRENAPGSGGSSRSRRSRRSSRSTRASSSSAGSEISAAKPGA
jgi:hypothetical protein